MSIASEISRLQTAKTDLKAAIEGKGVTVPSSTKLDGYANLVASIETGGGGSIESKLAEYEGFQFGVITGNNVGVYGVFAVSPLIEIPSTCANIRYRNGSPNGFIRIAFYNESQVGIASQVNYPTNSGGREGVNTAIQSTYKYVQICVNMSDIDNCYIKDVTNNTYLWKGKSVT